MLDGQIYYDRDDKQCVIVQRLMVGTWVLLSGPAPACHGGTYMPIMSKANGDVFYTEAELRKKLKDEGWQYTKARLVVEVATVSGMLPMGDWDYFKNYCGG